MKSESEFYGKEKCTFVIDKDLAAGLRLISAVLGKNYSEVIEDAVTGYLQSKPKIMAAIEETKQIAKESEAKSRAEISGKVGSSDVVDVREKDADRSE
jgi:hypothetical protein